MKVHQSNLHRNWLHIILAFLIGFSVVAVFIAVSGMQNVKSSSKHFSSFFFEDRKADVKNEVLNRIDEIDYELENLMDEEKRVIYSKVHIMKRMLLNHVDGYADPPDQLRASVIAHFEQMASTDPDYLHFALTKEGVLLRSGTDNTLAGTNLIDLQDKDGIYYIKELVKAAEVPEGVYVTYYWPKVKGGEPLKKISYCLYIPELDLLIGTGSYEEDILKHLKANVFDRLQSYYADKEDYVFVTSYEGKALVSVNPDWIGKDMTTFTSFDGKSIHASFMEVIEQNGEGFVTYEYLKKDSDSLSEKTSYVKDLKNWDAYIGMGFHTDDLNQEISAYTSNAMSQNNRQVLFALGLLTITGAMVYRLIRKGSKLQREYLKQEDIIFEQLFQLTSEGILILSHDGDIQYQNSIIDRMIGDNLSQYISGGELLLDKVDENIYKFINQNDRTYFTNVSSEDIVFQGTDSTLYSVKDITDQYLKTNEFEQMALIDPLTGLPNRRKLMNDYEDYFFSDKDVAPLIVAIIDLDDFKKVNDKYGHNVGDEILKCLGTVFINRLRSEDKLYRYGGEEFIVLLKDLALPDAQNVLAEINRIFASASLDEVGIEQTFSGGATITQCIEGVCPLQKAIRNADQLLYQAKRNGKNRIEIELDN